MDGQRAKILLVDDDQTTCALIKRVFARNDEQLRCKVEVVPTLNSAIETLRSEEYDNVLLDLGLPDSGGAETVRMVHENCPDVPITVITAERSEETELLARRYGATTYIVKGHQPWEQLVGVVRDTIEKRFRESGFVKDYCRYKAAFDLIECPIVCLDDDLHVLNLNRACREMFEIGEQSFAGMKLGEVFNWAKEITVEKVKAKSGFSVRLDADGAAAGTGCMRFKAAEGKDIEGGSIYIFYGSIEGPRQTGERGINAKAGRIADMRSKVVRLPAKKIDSFMDRLSDAAKCSDEHEIANRIYEIRHSGQGDKALENFLVSIVTEKQICEIRETVGRLREGIGYRE